MREKERIKRILGLIEELWEENQDFRFTQLLIFLDFAQDSPRWHWEDTKIEEILKEKLRKGED